MRFGKTGVAIGLAVAAPAAYSYHASHRLVAERVAAMRGPNTMPPNEIVGHFVRPVRNFGDIPRNIDFAISQQYPLKRDFYTPERLAQISAIVPETAVVTQDDRDLKIVSSLSQSVLTLPASTVGSGIVEFTAHYRESITGKAEGSGGFFLPDGNPIHFADIVGWLGYGFTGSSQKGWVHGWPPPSDLFGNGEIIYGTTSCGPYDANISATFYPDGSLMALNFHDTPEIGAAVSLFHLDRTARTAE